MGFASYLSGPIVPLNSVSFVLFLFAARAETMTPDGTQMVPMIIIDVAYSSALESEGPPTPHCHSSEGMEHHRIVGWEHVAPVGLHNK